MHAYLDSYWSLHLTDGDFQEDDVIDQYLILVWGQQRRIITGADLLGRLLRGIVTREKVD